ncbi:unnamed protein product [Mytilus edulis]|uniref:Uncharacterized protein n=1 Tax=Mytilus edulis TaxID=6550 RepID=A0A8S3R5N2_MYTED|nr:unnamed protein product [Mytilus edulis]
MQQQKCSSCASVFGSGWTEKGKCCRNKPCCVYILAVQCEDIPPNNLINGAVTVTERTIGSTANFTCDAGHSLVGNETITCSSSGWNGNIPQCRFQCEDIPPNNLTNGAVTVTERTIGSTANFTCDAGHSLVGNETITCSSSGWNGNIPQCRLYILCPETRVDFGGSKYIFSCNKATWSDSEKNCIARGGHLTSIGTGDENTFILDVLKLMKDIRKLTTISWIGLTYNNDEKSYKWLSGEPLNYSNWNQGPPQQPDTLNFRNRPGAYCALIDQSLHWRDEFCSSKLRAICEIRTVICFQLQTNFSTKEDTDYFIDQGKNSTMFNCWYVIVIALSIYHETNAEKLTHQCTAAQGRCAPTKDSTCERSFGSGWTANGSCCRRKPCCVYFQCEDISSERVSNGIVTVKEEILVQRQCFPVLKDLHLWETNI